MFSRFPVTITTASSAAAIDVSADGRLIAIGDAPESGAPSGVVLIDPLTGSVVQDFLGGADFVGSVAFLPGAARLLAMARQGNDLRLVELALNETQERVVRANIPRMATVTCAPDGRNCALADGQRVEFIDMESGDVVSSIAGDDDANGLVDCAVRFHPMKRIAYISGGAFPGRVVAYDYDGDRVVAELRGLTGDTKQLSISSGGEWVTVTGLQFEALIIAVESGSSVGDSMVEKGWIGPYVFSGPDTVVSCGAIPALLNLRSGDGSDLDCDPLFPDSSVIAGSEGATVIVAADWHSGEVSWALKRLA